MSQHPQRWFSEFFLNYFATLKPHKTQEKHSNKATELAFGGRRSTQHNVQITRLSNRDRDRFLEALDASDTKPNTALKVAARRYGKLRG